MGRAEERKAGMVDHAGRVERAVQCWNDGDLAGYLTLYDDAIKLHGYSPEPMGKAAVTAFYELVCASLGEAGRPNPSLLLHEVATDRELYCCRFTMSGIHRGPFLGMPVTGRPYSLGGITMMRFSGDRVVERWSNSAMLGGAIPAPQS
jgi:SnoaL-like polyketide cyclase